MSRFLDFFLSLEVGEGGDDDKSGDAPKDMEDDMNDLLRPACGGDL